MDASSRIRTSDMKKPYVPQYADKQRIEAEDYTQASPECICPACHLPYWKHRQVAGYLWLTRLCNGKFVKL